MRRRYLRPVGKVFIIHRHPVNISASGKSNCIRGITLDLCGPILIIPEIRPSFYTEIKTCRRRLGIPSLFPRGGLSIRYKLSLIHISEPTSMSLLSFRIPLRSDWSRLKLLSS